jgi:hypothetical protein
MLETVRFVSYVLKSILVEHQRRSRSLIHIAIRLRVHKKRFGSETRGITIKFPIGHVNPWQFQCTVFVGDLNLLFFLVRMSIQYKHNKTGL